MSIREYPCCMCPASYDIREVCENCEFYNVYKDSRGWTYFVRAGLGERQFKAFYLKPGKPGGGHAYANLPWRKTREEAQADLNALAIRKGWRVVKEVPGFV